MGERKRALLSAERKATIPPGLARGQTGGGGSRRPCLLFVSCHFRFFRHGRAKTIATFGRAKGDYRQGDILDRREPHPPGLARGQTGGGGSRRPCLLFVSCHFRFFRHGRAKTIATFGRAKGDYRQGDILDRREPHPPGLARGQTGGGGSRRPCILFVVGI